MPVAIQLHNTRTRRLEPFQPLQPNEAGIYTCGPTVYQYTHLGNFRTYVVSDLLRRLLEYQGFAVKHVMNITDVGHLVGDGDEGEDRLEVGAKREGKTAWEIASYYTDAFLHDLARLNLRQPHVLPRATQHIPEQIALIEQLETKGFTYRTGDGIYFETSKLSDYGSLLGQDRDQLLAGARVEVNPEKHHPADFALWKFSEDRRQTTEDRADSSSVIRPPSSERRQMEWDSPWGVGFPGWHIECSAMSVKYLGQPFDLHIGGEDLVFPHHTNESAQTEAATGQPLANYWLHGAFMSVDGAKMSKSLGNTYTVEDVVKRGHDPLAFRYLTLQTHYRKPLNFTWEAVQAADQALANLRALVRELPEEGTELDPATEEEFRTHIGHDLGLPQALALFWDVLKSDREAGEKTTAVQHWDQVFGLGLADQLGKLEEIPTEVSALVAKREQARGAGEYGQADELRSKLTDLGYTVDDTPDGPKVHRVEKPTEL
ncbi:cysteine--tRNA ligase [Candidatus Berkelbacteria bacterium]|nr:cysteine--tRNA ligase [Candidatus Berkelbacteria bacterium]